MRRIAAILAAAGAAAGLALANGAGADDAHSYRIEMRNAFGVLEGSEVRVAGVRSGTVEEIEINAAKRAVATIEISGELGVLGDRTRCSTEPQSLIAEYFIDCDPRGDPLPDGATLPASRVRQTVQLDLVLNTLRASYRERLRLIVNEFGTALAGNADDLSAAIRESVPALSELRGVTRILARQRRALAALNTDAARIVTRLAERRDDVASAVTEARDTTAIAAARRADLGRDVDLVDDFAAELEPAFAELGEVSRAGAPLLASLRAAAPGLNRLAIELPGFGASAGTATRALGDAAVPGIAALERGGDEVRALTRAGKRAAPVAEIVADLLRDLDDPRRAVETDARAARTCDDPTLPCWGTGREAPTGFTGLESILNYTHYQAGALNQFDSLGHILQFNVYSGGFGPCDRWNARPDVPAIDGGRTTDILDAHPCVNWLGRNQPGVNLDLGLPRYDNAVCPNGSADLSLCDPNISTDGAARTGGAASFATRGPDDSAGAGAAPGGGPIAPPDPAGGAPDEPAGALGEILDQILDLPRELRPGLGESLGGGGGRRGGGSGGALGDLLDFLLGP
jgi:phospholipid/cholesterol/gamma-HCH transport system substrate-binding protein